jgi:hypothetical protein
LRQDFPSSIEVRIPLAAVIVRLKQSPLELLEKYDWELDCP